MKWSTSKLRCLKIRLYPQIKITILIFHLRILIVGDLLKNGIYLVNIFYLVQCYLIYNILFVDIFLGTSSFFLLWFFLNIQFKKNRKLACCKMSTFSLIFIYMNASLTFNFFKIKTVSSYNSIFIGNVYPGLLGLHLRQPQNQVLSKILKKLLSMMLNSMSAQFRRSSKFLHWLTWCARFSDVRYR